jgi:hypothetical protein
MFKKVLRKEPFSSGHYGVNLFYVIISECEIMQIYNKMVSTIYDTLSSPIHNFIMYAKFVHDFHITDLLVGDPVSLQTPKQYI